MIEVTQIIYTNWDPDDEKLSEARATTVKRKWCVDPASVIAWGESKRNKDYLELWFSTGDSMFIQSTYEEFKEEMDASEIVIQLNTDQATEQIENN